MFNWKKGTHTKTKMWITGCGCLIPRDPYIGDLYEKPFQTVQVVEYEYYCEDFSAYPICWWINSRWETGTGIEIWKVTGNPESGDIDKDFASLDEAKAFVENFMLEAHNENS